MKYCKRGFEANPKRPIDLAAKLHLLCNAILSESKSEIQSAPSSSLKESEFKTLESFIKSGRKKIAKMATTKQRRAVIIHEEKNREPLEADKKKQKGRASGGPGKI